MEADARGDVIVFAGPTIGRVEIGRILTADVRGPVKRGDVYLATLSRPRAIAIVDGHFDQTPALWHKEVLWALTLGIPVYGSSSMGALRAAELHQFGMNGVGVIYEQLVSGEITADDEVVVAHATRDGEWRPLSEALVNIRATLRAAERCGILGRRSQHALEDAARALFFPQRTYPAILEKGRDLNLGSAELSALAAWLPQGRVDQKKLDAVRMLTEIHEERADNARPKPSFIFQQTDAWLRLRSNLDRSLAATGRGATPPNTTPGELKGVSPDAILRAIAMNEALLHRTVVTAGHVDEVVEQFRRERGLEGDADFTCWLEEHFVDDAAVRDFFVEEVLVRAVCHRFGAAAARYQPNAVLAGAPVVK